MALGAFRGKERRACCQIILCPALAGDRVEKRGDTELAKGIRKKYEMTVARLQTAADLEISPGYRNGRLIEIKVRVKNIRADHNLPTSLTNAWQMWLEIKAKHNKGRSLWSSGAVGRDGRLPADARLFNSDGMDDAFHFAFDPWKVTAFSRHDTIPPLGYRDVFYGLTLPDDLSALTVEVKLRYRQADQEVMEAILAMTPPDVNLQTGYKLTPVPAMPVVDMVVKEVSLDAQQGQ